MLASAGRDKSIKLWDIGTWTVIRTLLGHGDIVRSVAFAPDAKTLASGSVDRTGNLRQTLTDPQTRLESLAFTPDGTILASSSGGPEAFLWLWPIGGRK